MNILHVINSLDPSQGGPPQVCALLAGEQAKNHHVTLVSYSPPETLREYDVQETVQYIQAPVPNLQEKLVGTSSLALFRERVPGINAIHIHGVWESILASAAKVARDQGIPYAVRPAGMLDPWCIGQKKYKKKLALLLGRRAYLENAKFIHTLSDHELAGVRQLGLTGRCEVIPNGVSLDRVDPLLNPSLAEETFPQLADRPFVLFLGRLHPIKGLDVLVEALPQLFAAEPDWQVALAGPDGGMKAELEKRLHELKIEDQVHLLGPVYGPAKYSLLARANLFCLPSQHEGCSMALLEAMAAGKPLVISEHCHLPQVTQHGCGLEVPLDAKSVGNALVKLAGSESARTEMGQNARQVIEREFTWERISQRLIDCFLD